MKLSRICGVLTVVVLMGTGLTATPAAAQTSLQRPRVNEQIIGTPKQILAATPIAQPLTVGYRPGMFLASGETKKKGVRGCTWRNQVLIELAATKPRIGPKCTLIGGEWLADFGYTKITKSSKVRLGKLLPDKYVYAQGAFGWTPAQRAAYANAALQPRLSSRGMEVNNINNGSYQILSRSGFVYINSVTVLLDREILDHVTLERELRVLRDKNPALFDAWTVATLLNAKAWGLSLSPGTAGTFALTIEECSVVNTTQYKGVTYVFINAGKMSRPVSETIARANPCTLTYSVPNSAARFNIRPVPLSASAVAPLSDLVLRGYGTPTGPEISKFMFGIHAPAHWESDAQTGFEGGIEPTSIPNVPVGSVRLWDTETAWADVEPQKGMFVYSNLRKQVELAQRLNARPMLVLGGTPKWAGGGGRNAVPTDIDDYKNYVRAIACQFGKSIFAYEVWNEANIKDFWAGTPAQMADLTAAAFESVRACNPDALVVAASTTTRATGSFGTFYPEYLEELKKRNWPVDAYSVHSYPAASGGADARIKGIGQFKTMLALAGAPKTTIFDTETNYGLAGLGESRIAYSGANAMSLISRTYIDSARYGIDATYWFVWTRGEDSKYGVQMNPNSKDEATAWRTTYDWIVGSRFQRCQLTLAKITVCQFSRGSQNFSIVWSGDIGGTVVTTAPGYFADLGNRGCDLTGSCIALPPQGQVVVGPTPLRIDTVP